MQLISSVFEHNKPIPSKYTCDAENVSPPLSIKDVPHDAKSLVLIVEDPDAVSKSPWIHWIVFNIPPLTTAINEDDIPTGAALGITDFGTPGWGGPCPPSGNHRYFFKLYAVDTMFKFETPPDAQQVKESILDHTIATAELIGLYQRQ